MDAKTEKFVKDVVHGYIKISFICVKIIDTAEFQRLRNIKQLGFVSFVYPSANHTRFEHCIGVSYLAGKMARRLLEDFDYTEKENAKWIKCAEIAGLCHDLGHGPFSHDSEKKLSPGYKHEEKSIERFEKLCQSESIEKYITDEEREIIKAMILPEKYSEIIQNDIYKGKEFMFQIVSNEENGIDVDKWDYLTRDAFYLGLNSNFDYMRLIAHAKALGVDGRMHICYPLKLKEHIHGIYHLRRWLYKHGCQHPVVLCISEMFADAVKEAGLTIPEESTDAIYYDLRGKSDVISRIERRELYFSLGGIPRNKLFPDGEQSNENAKTIFLEKFKGAKDIPNKEELRCDSHSFKYGKIAKDAFKKIYFYTKSEPKKAEALPEAEIDPMFSPSFAEPTFYFFSTRNGDFKDLQKKIKECVNSPN